MNRLLYDSGPLIATFNKKESQHQRCVRLLAEWPGRLLVPEIAFAPPSWPIVW